MWGLVTGKLRTSPLGGGKKARAKVPAKGSLASLGINNFGCSGYGKGGIVRELWKVV